MEINKKELQKSLEIVKPGLASKEIIEQSTSFAFVDGRVVTYNDEISISHPVTGLTISGAVEAENLYKLLNKIKEDVIEIELKEKEILISSGKTKAGLTLQSEVTLPLDQEISNIGNWKELPEHFVKFLGFAMSSCSKDMSRPILTAIHVNKEGIIEASDGYKIINCTLDEIPVNSFLLPASSAIHVTKLNPTKIAGGRGWIHFRTEEDTILSCRIFHDDFPETKNLLSIDGVKITFPKKIEEVLDKAMIFSKRDHILEETLTLSIADNKLKIEASAKTGWFEEELNMRYRGEPLSIFITPYLLRGILKETKDCIVSDNKLKFEGDGWEYISMLK